MGYRSYVVIGMTKVKYAEIMLFGKLPEILTETPKTVDDDVYWHIDSIKWYPSYDDIDEIENFFRELEDIDGQPVFGALRIGEDDDDIQTWGNPSDFSIYTNKSISSPIT